LYNIRNKKNQGVVMIKKICIVVLFLFTTFSFAGEYDKGIVVKNQSRNDKVKTVFKEMMNAYEEEDIGQFFSYVSEDRFQQDYMTFYDAIDEDIRVYDILNVDTWVDKITEDGVKRFLYVQWEKRYLATSSDTEINQRGYSRFLFDEINGKYKLIQLAGNNFWGKSLKEWTDEVLDIAGQVEELNKRDSLPDLVIQNFTCPSGFGGAMPIEFNLVNIGDAATHFGSIEYTHSSFSMPYIRTYNGDLEPGESVTITGTADCYGGETATVDPNDLIDESNPNNNTTTYSGGISIHAPH
jgi:hypothetical protein